MLGNVPTYRSEFTQQLTLRFPNREPQGCCEKAQAKLHAFCVRTTAALGTTGAKILGTLVAAVGAVLLFTPAAPVGVGLLIGGGALLGASSGISIADYIKNRFDIGSGEYRTFGDDRETDLESDGGVDLGQRPESDVNYQEFSNRLSSHNFVTKSCVFHSERGIFVEFGTNYVKNDGLSTEFVKKTDGTNLLEHEVGTTHDKYGNPLKQPDQT